MIKRWLWVIIPVVILCSLVFWRLSTRDAQAAQLGAGPGGAPSAPGGKGGAPAGRGGPGGRAPTVQVAVAGPGQIITSIQAVGNVESPFKVQISPKTTGRIEFIEAREGDPVTPGQVLVRVDPTELQAAVVQAQANVAEAKSRLAQALLTQNSTNVGITSQIDQQKATVASARADLRQVRGNYDAQVASAQAGVTDATAKVASAQAQVLNAQATLAQQQATLSNATAKYNRTHSLYTQGFVAAQDVDDAKTAMDVQAGGVKVAQGQVSAAQHAVSSAKAQLNEANQQYSIAKRKGVADIAASQAKATQADSGLTVAKANTANSSAYQANLAALKAQVDAAIAALNQAKSRLADATLRSPIKGTVTDRSGDIGSLASPGNALLTVQFIDWLYVLASVPIDQSSSVFAGQVAEVSFDALPGRAFEGVLSNVNAAADPQSRQFSVRIKLDNKSHTLRPGMFGHVSLVTKRVFAPVTIPNEALKRDRDNVTAVVIGEDNKAEVRSVKLGAANEKTSQILEGLSAGDRVVTLSYAPLRDGQTIQLPGAKKEPSPGGTAGRRRSGGQ